MSKLPTAKTEKDYQFEKVSLDLVQQGFRVVDEDRSRPWGGFFVLDERQVRAFAEAYFEGIPADQLQLTAKLSPKLLLVAPQQRLSWQYHHRRAEIWQVVQGPVGVVMGVSDTPTGPERLETGQRVALAPEQRHRLVGLANWGIVAELWQHTDPALPSDEYDIVRLEDDFGR